MQTNTSFKAALETITELELAALLSAFESSKGAGHDFGYTQDIVIFGQSKKAVGGVISSLIQKGIIERDDEYGQFAFGSFGDEKYANAKLVAEILAK